MSCFYTPRITVFQNVLRAKEHSTHVSQIILFLCPYERIYQIVLFYVLRGVVSQIILFFFVPWRVVSQIVLFLRP